MGWLYYSVRQKLGHKQWRLKVHAYLVHADKPETAVQSSAYFFSWHHMVYCYMQLAHLAIIAMYARLLSYAQTLIKLQLP